MLFGPEILLLGIYPIEMKAPTTEYTHARKFIATLSVVAKSMNKANTRPQRKG